MDKAEEAHNAEERVETAGPADARADVVAKGSAAAKDVEDTAVKLRANEGKADVGTAIPMGPPKPPVISIGAGGAVHGFAQPRRHVHGRISALHHRTLIDNEMIPLLTKLHC